MPDGSVLNPDADGTEAGGDPVALSQRLVVAAKAADRDVSDELRALSSALRSVDPFALAGDPARIAFWTNVYNALMRHAVVGWDLRAGSRVPLATYWKAAYRVGARTWSLHAIEHGVLRRNRPAPFTFWDPLPKGDPRLGALPSTFDARVHFALNCAAASCPPIRSYDADGLDAQLDAAARAYVTQETALDRARLSARIPYLCDLYARDFGPGRDALAWLTRYLDEGDRAWVEENLARVTISRSAYRWEIVR